MSDQALHGRRILLVEDEYFLARDVARDLAAAGAAVVGPVPSLAEAMAALVVEPALDGAVLDVNLGGEMVYPVADALAARGVPFVLTTGYDLAALPPRFADRPRCEKPIDSGELIAAIGRTLGGAAQARSAAGEEEPPPRRR